MHSLATSIILVYASTLCCGFTHILQPISCRRQREVPFTIRHSRKQVIYQSNQSQAQLIEDPCIRLEVSSSFGVDKDELTYLLEAMSSVCDEYGVQLDQTKSTICSSSQPKSVPGALGRAVIIDVHGAADVNVEESDFITELKNDISQQIDGYLYSGQLSQPVLLAFQCATAKSATLNSIIEKEVLDYGLRDGINRETTQANHDDASFIPSRHIQLDGAMIETIESPGQLHFDTSSVVVLDNILDESLRRRLLNVVKGYPEDTTDDIWDDAKDGPNPNRWVRGGLMDVVDSKSDEEDDGPCWGLTDDAIIDICFHDHPAINEFEAKLGQLFSDFIVTTLPEAVLGDCVSPITANAPVYGDTFEFHIDADPMQVPPSPWADIFGRYPNRSREKPRFVSVLLYLNDVWEAEEWGAPTAFLDPPTQELYEVFPQPGRCVIMDQDISHTVVAPRKEAGKRPRYSMVWKLILHPKQAGQDMTDLSCGRGKLWPKPELLGSAVQQEM
eukprot:scaffold17147_cov136-Skeletonema_menzelii.AAC.1